VTAARRRGELWLAERDKVRPVVVLTRDPMGGHLSAVLVGPIT
jgi:mRNA-degrading endonuclease toxin of MazEF toxin-antitoxin module